jgi:hypothetical protein
MGILSKTKVPDPVAELGEARDKRTTVSASLPALRQKHAEAASTRATLANQLEHIEEDATIGRASAGALDDLRARHEKAVAEHRRTGGLVRQAEAELTDLDAMIVRLIAEATTHFVEKHKILATQFEKALVEAAALNDQLHAHYRAAEAVFPPKAVRNGVSLGYPVAAGLLDLSWYELRHNPNSEYGGRLGGWRKVVSDFRNPPEPKPARRSTSPTPTLDAAQAGPWQPLKEGA